MNQQVKTKLKILLQNAQDGPERSTIVDFCRGPFRTTLKKSHRKIDLPRMMKCSFLIFTLKLGTKSRAF